MAAIPTSTLTETPAATNTATATAPATAITTVKDTATASTTAIAEINLSTDPENPGSCTFDQIKDGTFLANEMRNLRRFPADAVNAGWISAEGGTTSDLILTSKSNKAEQIISICTISDEFLGLPSQQSYVVGLQVLNPDKSSGHVHFLLDDKSQLDLFVSLLAKSNGIGIGIVREHPANIVANNPDIPTFRLYDTEGNAALKQMVDNLQASGIVSTNMETMLFTASDATQFPNFTSK